MTAFGRFLKKAAITTAAAFTFLTVAPDALQAQNTGNQKSGNSLAHIFKEVQTRVKDVQTGSGINGATVHYNSIYIPPSNDTTTTYTVVTDGSGFTPPEDILVYQDTTVGIDDQEKQETIPPTVFPQPSADFNIAFYMQQPNQKATLQVFDISGRKVLEDTELDGLVGNYAHFYADLSNKADGIYLGIISTPNSIHKVKLNKVGNSVTGQKLLQNIPPSQPQTKSGQAITEDGASYQVIISADGYQTLVDTISDLFAGYQIFTYELTPEAGLPQHQDIGGTVKDRNDVPLSGATVWIREQGTNTLLGETTTNSNGEYELADIPTGKDFYFGVGGLAGRFAFEGDEASTIDEVVIPADTANLNFHYILYNKTQPVPNSGGQTVTLEADHIAAMVSNSNIEAALHTMKFYLGNSLSESEKNIVRNHFDQLEQMIGVSGLYEESSVPLNTNIQNYDPYNPQAGEDPGINIEKGTNNTQPGFVEVTTPLGNTLISRFKAEQTLNLEWLGFVHEEGRTFFSQVGHYSIMRADAPEFTHADRATWNIDLEHFKKVYDFGTVYFNLNNIKENLSQ